MVYILLFFSLQNSVCFIILTCLVPVLFTFYIQSVLKLKKNNSGAKRLMLHKLNKVNVYGAQKGPSKGLGASGLKGLEPSY